MRSTLIATFISLITVTLADGQNSQRVVEPTPTPQAAHIAGTKPRPELDAIFAAWEAADQRIDTLLLVFERIDKSKKWGDQVYEGMAVFKRPNQVCLEFKKANLDANGKPKVVEINGSRALEFEKVPFQRFVWSKDEIFQYEWDEQAIYIYPRLTTGWLKALEGGLLPSLFNMKAAEAKARYGMTLLNQDHYPDDYLIAIVPREEIDKESFQRAFVYLNKKSFLPSQVVLFPIGDKDMQHFRFTNIQPNQPIDDAYFHPSTNIPKWKVVRNSLFSWLLERSSTSSQVLPADHPEPVAQPRLPAVNPEH